MGAKASSRMWWVGAIGGRVVPVYRQAAGPTVANVCRLCATGGHGFRPYEGLGTPFLGGAEEKASRGRTPSDEVGLFPRGGNGGSG